MAHLHHVFFNVPIALVASAAGLLLASLALGSPTMRRAGELSLLIGTMGAVLTAATGLLSQDVAAAQGVPLSAIQDHQATALVGLGLTLLASSLWCVGAHKQLMHASLFRWGVPLVTVAAAVAIAWAAHRGGAMLHPGLLDAPRIPTQAPDHAAPPAGDRSRLPQ